jgi:hypothetical protein
MMVVVFVACVGCGVETLPTEEGSSGGERGPAASEQVGTHTEALTPLRCPTINLTAHYQCSASSPGCNAYNAETGAIAKWDNKADTGCALAGCVACPASAVGFVSSGYCAGGVCYGDAAGGEQCRAFCY